MAYISVGRVAQAIESLKRFHAFFGVTFLSMKKEGVKVGEPIVWGQAQENDLLNNYYTPPGGSAEKPYFLPFRSPEKEYWKNPKYSGGVLQRARTTDNFKDALYHPTSKTWAFHPNYIAVLQALLPKDQQADNVIKIPVFDVAAWIYRDVDLPTSLADVKAKFRSEFGFVDDSEFDAIFDSTEEGADNFYFSEPMEREELVRLTGGIPDGPSLGARSEKDLVEFLESWIKERELLTLPEGYVKSFYYALKAQKFVILSGRPGTGKTAFVRAFSRALAEFFPNAVTEINISVSQEFSEADVIGYEKIAGDLAATELTKKLFLSGRPRDIYVVMLDEMNLSQVDYYFGRLLPAIESDALVDLPGDNGSQSLPPDTLVIGTVNSYLEESTRLPLSGPVKRRANVIEMPNYLEKIVLEPNRERFSVACTDLLKQSAAHIENRRKSGLVSVLDGFRNNNFQSALEVESPVLDDKFLNALWGLCEICAASSVTGLTFGVLQDVLDYVAMADESVMKSLDHQIAQKIVPQLSGPASVVRNLLSFVDQLEATDGEFAESRGALLALLRSEDSGSGMVTFMY